MKRKDLILFIAVTFLRSVFISMLKFFLRSYLKDAHITLEAIAGYLSLGGMIAYLVGSSIAYGFRKKSITLFSGLIAMFCVAIGHIAGYYPYRVFILLISSIGFAYSLWLIIKSIILSIEIQHSDSGEAKLNAIINIAILSGVLVGSYAGFASFARRGTDGFQFIIVILVFSSILTMIMDYDKHFEAKSCIETFKHSVRNIGGIIKKYVRLLLPIGSLRAISTAIVQKMLEIGVNIFERTPKSSITILIISFVGAILGHLISIFFMRKRKTIAIVFTIIFGLTTIYFPHIIGKFDYYITLHIFGFCIGVFFGIAVNLLEGRYFFHIGADHRKEYGSVGYGIMTSIIIFLIMIAADYLGRTLGTKISFFFFGIVLLLMPFFIRKFDASDISHTHLGRKKP